jgi:hypothetical protein
MKIPLVPHTGKTPAHQGKLEDIPPEAWQVLGNETSLLISHNQFYFWPNCGAPSLARPMLFETVGLPNRLSYGPWRLHENDTKRD